MYRLFSYSDKLGNIMSPDTFLFFLREIGSRIRGTEQIPQTQKRLLLRPLTKAFFYAIIITYD